MSRFGATKPTEETESEKPYYESCTTSDLELIVRVQSKDKDIGRDFLMEKTIVGRPVRKTVGE